MGHLDRYGEPFDDDHDSIPHRCQGGWIDPDKAIPCPVCRPWHGPCTNCSTPPRACRSQTTHRPCCDACSHAVPGPRRRRR